MLDEINRLKANLSTLSVYNPQFMIKKGSEDLKTIKQKIADDLRLKLESHFVEIDNRFTIENYEHCTTNLPSEKIKEVYQLLGPFDYT
jgi:hypothetical protein